MTKASFHVRFLLHCLLRFKLWMVGGVIAAFVVWFTYFLIDVLGEMAHSSGSMPAERSSFLRDSFVFLVLVGMPFSVLVCVLHTWVGNIPYPLCDGLGHKWRGCRCTRRGCEETQHEWDGCICSRPKCGEKKPVDDPSHDWTTCECPKCHQAIPHKFGDWQKVSGPTCEEILRCQRCPEVRTRMTHDWGEWTYNATAETKTHTCKQCPAIETFSTHAFDVDDDDDHTTPQDPPPGWGTFRS